MPEDPFIKPTTSIQPGRTEDDRMFCSVGAPCLVFVCRGGVHLKKLTKFYTAIILLFFQSDTAFFMVNIAYF